MSQQDDASPNPRKFGHSHTSLHMRQREADGGTGPRKNAEMIEGHGRMSGELEGSTLGNSSRDSERGSRRGQQKMQGSSSFLLDSSFGSRSKTLKGGQHRHQHQHQHHHSGRSENERMEKRALPEIDNADSRRKSRFSWRRKKPSVEASSSEAGDTASRPSRDNPQPSNTDRVEEIDKVEFSQSSRPSIGLDQDSIQIVNLALDLNESRKKGNLGRSGSHRVSEGAWVQGQFSANYVDSHTGGTVGPRGRAQGNRNDAHSFDEDRSREQLTTHEPLSVSKLLPNQTDDVSLPQDISENTLARVAKARRHFELFGEYLRLLPSLPPLRPQDHDSTNGGCRIYNPLQTIRNRKVRYREKCPINVEAEGWNDVGAVHEWVSNITHQYSEQSHGPLVCLRLPQLRQWQPQTSQDEDDNDDLYATTSPESMKHAPRSSSMKAHRQRFDWMVLPAELLADAAWVEDGMNKGRMMNKDGNNLYPDITELISSDANFDTSSGRQPSSSAKRVSLDVPSRPSFAEPSRVSSDYRKASRGRSRHRIQTPSSHIHSSSASTTDRRLGRPHSRARARSSSSISIDAGTSERSAFSSPLSTKLGRNSRTRPVQEDFSSPLSQSQKSPRWTSFDEKRASMSSIGSADDLRNRSTGLNSHMYPGFFPSMAINLSPPSSRSPSPSKRHFSRKMASRNERSKSKYRAVGVPEKGGKNSLDNDLSHKPISPDHAGLDHSATGGSGKVEFGPHPNQVQPVDLNEQAVDETPAPRHSGQHDSKLRGIFKGKGKLAEKVGNEVSKMGDFIMKKDHQAHSRQSSFATSATSEEADVEPETNNGKSGASKSLLRRLPPLSDDSPRQSRKELDKPAASKGQTPPKQPLASPVKEDNDDGGGALDLQSPRESGSALQPWDAKQLQGKALDETTASEPGKFDPNVSGRNLNEIFDIGPSLRKAQPQGKKRYIKDPSIPYSLTRPPVTGLAHAEATPPPSGYGKRPTMSGSWTISDRSIPTLADLGIFEKREVERTRALLLSSGIKAREITRRAETVRDPPDFLQNSTEPNSATPRVIRLREFDVASQNLDRSFKKSQTQFQQSINSFPSKTASPLKSQLDDLDNLVNNSLAPRVQSMGSDAETLTVKLNTTSTLALKQLSDTLDKGVRKRRRRLRWVRRTGFVMLEWALVGMLWWVWLIVMAFKLLRGVFRGTISSIRWVLWL